jgi:hypothetical protein
MTPDLVELRAPSMVVRQARNRAPIRTTSENRGRSSENYGDEDSSTAGYGSALLYVRKRRGLDIEGRAGWGDVGAQGGV